MPFLSCDKYKRNTKQRRSCTMLIGTVMALYTEACTVVRTDAGLSESFEVKVGLHQESVLSLLLFAAVMGVVSSEVRNSLPF